MERDVAALRHNDITVISSSSEAWSPVGLMLYGVLTTWGMYLKIWGQ